MLYMYIATKRVCVQQDTKACKRDSGYIAGFRIDTCRQHFREYELREGRDEAEEIILFD